MFKRNPKTNFLIENKFQQSILHMVLKAGYYNKIAVHGDEAGEVNVKTLEALFGDDAPIVQVCVKIGLIFVSEKNRFFAKENPKLFFCNTFLLLFFSPPMQQNYYSTGGENSFFLCLLSYFLHLPPLFSPT